MSARSYVEENELAAMLAAKRSASVAPEVNFRERVNKAATLALRPRGDVTRSPKQGISGPTKRIYVLQIFFKKYP